MGIGIVLMLVVVPFVHYRKTYNTNRRLRVATEDKVYRSGCMTAEGFRQAIRKHGIRTVVNLMNEAPDPDLANSFLSPFKTKESEVCKELGVRFEYLLVDLVHPSLQPEKRPATIDNFLKLMDDPTAYPVLIHCKAGLHRTGCLLALYRMEYEGWSKDDALRELKAHGFGERMSTGANEYIKQYILLYEPRPRVGAGNTILVSSPRSTPAIPVSRPTETKPDPAP